MSTKCFIQLKRTTHCSDMQEQRKQNTLRVLLNQTNKSTDRTPLLLDLVRPLWRASWACVVTRDWLLCVPCFRKTRSTRDQTTARMGWAEHAGPLARHTLICSRVSFLIVLLNAHQRGCVHTSLLSCRACFKMKDRWRGGLSQKSASYLRVNHGGLMLYLLQAGAQAITINHCI